MDEQNKTACAVFVDSSEEHGRGEIVKESKRDQLTLKVIGDFSGRFTLRTQSIMNNVSDDETLLDRVIRIAGANHPAVRRLLGLGAMTSAQLDNRDPQELSHLQSFAGYTN